MEFHIKKGDRLVFNGNTQPYATIRVEDVFFKKDEARWVLIVRWGENGEHGVSRLYGDDEGKSWRPYRELN